MTDNNCAKMCAKTKNYMKCISAYPLYVCGRITSNQPQPEFKLQVYLSVSLLNSISNIHFLNPRIGTITAGLILLLSKNLGSSKVINNFNT